MGVGGMGAASLEIELLWVGGPIAIQRTSTWSMSDMPCEDIGRLYCVRVRVCVRVLMEL